MKIAFPNTRIPLSSTCHDGNFTILQKCLAHAVKSNLFQTFHFRKSLSVTRTIFLSNFLWNPRESIKAWNFILRNGNWKVLIHMLSFLRALNKISFSSFLFSISNFFIWIFFIWNWTEFWNWIEKSDHMVRGFPLLHEGLPHLF